MIIFGTVSAFPEKLATQCAPGLARSMNGESYKHIVLQSNGVELFTLYQKIMNAAGEDPSCEALVLLHDDLEFRDTRLAEKIRKSMSSSDVAGLIGSRGAKSLAWWEGERCGSVTDDAYGLHDFGFDYGAFIDGHMYCEVDTLDGMCLILSPFAFRHLRLEGTGYVGFHGYADELCYQVRKYGRCSVAFDITAHHHSKGGYAGGVSTWLAANENFRKRWLT